MPKTTDDLLAYLDGLGIRHSTREHEAVFTVAESQALRETLDGGHTKNLFIKDKKGRHFLLTVGDEAEIDLKQIHKRIGAQGRVSFGKPEEMMSYLGVTPGSVTAFGIINDDDHQVTLIFDADLMQHEVINAHPLRNTATTSIGRDDLLTFVRSFGREVLVMALSAPPDALETD